MLFIFATIENKENRSRLEALYNQYASQMYKVAIRILKDEYLAQDAVQKAFVNISNNIRKIGQTDRNKIRALLVIIVRNASIDIYRIRKKQSGVSFDEMQENFFDSGPSVEELVVNDETLATVAEKIKELHPSYADILSLKYYYQYTDEEISKILNITLENIRTRLHRARKSLIKLLSQEQEEKNNE